MYPHPHACLGAVAVYKRHDSIALSVQICFPESSNGAADWMISSSADGFINVMDLKDGLDEDDAFRVRTTCYPAKDQKYVGVIEARL